MTLGPVQVDGYFQRPIPNNFSLSFPRYLMQPSRLLLLSILAISTLVGCGARATPRSIHAMTIVEFYDLLKVEQKDIDEVLSKEENDLFMRGRMVAVDSVGASRLTVGEAIEEGRRIRASEVRPGGPAIIVPPAADK